MKNNIGTENNTFVLEASPACAAASAASGMAASPFAVFSVDAITIF